MVAARRGMLIESTKTEGVRGAAHGHPPTTRSWYLLPCPPAPTRDLAISKHHSGTALTHSIPCSFFPASLYLDRRRPIHLTGAPDVRRGGLPDDKDSSVSLAAEYTDAARGNYRCTVYVSPSGALPFPNEADTQLRVRLSGKAAVARNARGAVVLSLVCTIADLGGWEQKKDATGDSWAWKAAEVAGRSRDGQRGQVDEAGGRGPSKVMTVAQQS
ncbi:hypothetical protein B0H14DRAFT_3868112 [Mycena olivaceomarginata]|nr:hypothetical protein B0H14DRAFT_3868112 [Mycena olivaceomarginata]